MSNIITPVDFEKLDELLTATHYSPNLKETLVNSFKFGFDLRYRGPEDVQMKSKNLKLTVGSTGELWEKMMKETRLKRFAGPFEKIPFKNFIQSPVGLVPKDGGKKTRLIFHLSYPRDSGKSVNENTPQELCSVQYPAFDEAVKLCLKAGRGCSAGKSDLTSAFRHLGIRKQDWKFLVMKAKKPRRW